MPLIGLIGGLAAVTMVLLWTVVRIYLYSLQADDDNLPQMVGEVTSVYQTFVALSVLYLLVEYEVLTGIARWLTDVWTLIMTLL